MSPLTATGAKAFLSARGIATTSTNTGYLNRLVRQYNRQQELGLPWSRPAARGRPITPEHPGRRRTRTPVQASLYQQKRSKYQRMTEPLYAPRLTTPAPRVTRPLRHNRGADVGPEGVINVPGREIHTAYTLTGAMRVLRKLASADRATWAYNRAHPIKGQAKIEASNVYEFRVGFDIYDCTSQQWVSIYRNIGRGRTEYSAGMTVHEILRRLTEEEVTLEQYLIQEAINHYAPRRPLTHICAYVIYASKPLGSTIVR